MVMTKKLTRKPWWMTSRLANSKSGVTWPMPGLGRKATCGFSIFSGIVMAIKQMELIENREKFETNVIFCNFFQCRNKLRYGWWHGNLELICDLYRERILFSFVSICMISLHMTHNPENFCKRKFNLRDIITHDTTGHIIDNSHNF